MYHVATHSGKFHADDVLAFAMIKEFFSDELKLSRTRDLKIIAQADIVFDVGGTFDPDKRRFDHHQKIYEGPLSSAGMVLNWLETDNYVEKDLAAAALIVEPLLLTSHAKGLAREVLPSDITVNCIAPSIAVTDLLDGMTEEYIEDKKSRIPMGRFCMPEEIANMAAFIASPACSFTTGQVFDVTGGRATW